jgi:biotin transport system substrate-specific component
MPNTDSSAPSAPLALPFRWPLAIAGGALVVALSSQVAVPLPFTPVPMTLQGLAVILVGGTLGGAAGASAMVFYLLLGAFGAPVFALGASGIARLLGPTGGYLLAFPVAAAVVGRVAVRGSLPRCLLAALLGMVAIHAGGLAQLAILTGGLDRAVQLGTAPFLVLDLLKVVVAAVLLSFLHYRLRPRA